ncbi:MAG: hypothetical protein ACT4PS_10410 [Betaproteobacteria bacterium]
MTEPKRNIQGEGVKESDRKYRDRTIVSWYSDARMSAAVLTVL